MLELKGGRGTGRPAYEQLFSQDGFPYLHRVHAINYVDAEGCFQPLRVRCPRRIILVIPIVNRPPLAVMYSVSVLGWLGGSPELGNTISSN